VSRESNYLKPGQKASFFMSDCRLSQILVYLLAADKAILRKTRLTAVPRRSRMTPASLQVPLPRIVLLIVGLQGSEECLIANLVAQRLEKQCRFGVHHAAVNPRRIQLFEVTQALGHDIIIYPSACRSW